MCINNEQLRRARTNSRCALLLALTKICPKVGVRLLLKRLGIKDLSQDLHNLNM